jgi:transposase
MEGTVFDAMSREELVAFALKAQARNIALESEKIATIAENIALKEKVEGLVSRNLEIIRQLDQLRRMVFGARSERFVPSDPGQLELDLGLSMEAAGKDAETERIEYTREKKKRKEKPVRQPLPADLPRVVIEIEPGIDTTGMKYIGDEVTEELEYKPATLFVNQYRRRKYIAAGTDEKTTIVCGKLPSRPIDKGMAGAALLAHIIAEKFLWHIPFYRQWQRFASRGIKIPASTMGDWSAQVAQLLLVLYDELRKRMLASGYVQADETHIKVLESEKKGSAHKGYYWLYRSALQKIVLFDYQPGRGKAGPVRMLLDYKGWLQTDAYAAYDGFEQKSGVFLVGCLAHVRRYFEQALGNDKERSEWMLGKIRDLYAIERKAREAGMTHGQRKKLREDESLDILNEIGQWLQENCTRVLPKSAIGIALGYFMGRYKYVCRIVEDGQLEIDNNLAENQIRPIAIGRKNYLFAGSHDAARNAAVIYTLLATAKANGLDPEAWLADVLARIQDHPVSRIAELLPLEGEYKPGNQAAIEAP